MLCTIVLFRNTFPHFHVYLGNISLSLSLPLRIEKITFLNKVAAIGLKPPQKPLAGTAAADPASSIPLPPSLKNSYGPVLPPGQSAPGPKPPGPAPSRSQLEKLKQDLNQKLAAVQKQDFKKPVGNFIFQHVSPCPWLFYYLYLVKWKREIFLRYKEGRHKSNYVLTNINHTPNFLVPTQISTDKKSPVKVPGQLPSMIPPPPVGAPSGGFKTPPPPPGAPKGGFKTPPPPPPGRLSRFDKTTGNFPEVNHVSLLFLYKCKNLRKKPRRDSNIICKKYKSVVIY